MKGGLLLVTQLHKARLQLCLDDGQLHLSEGLYLSEAETYGCQRMCLHTWDMAQHIACS